MGHRLHGELDVWEVMLAHDFDPNVDDPPLDFRVE
jgi:hypothetical protein